MKKKIVLFAIALVLLGLSILFAVKACEPQPVKPAVVNAGTSIQIFNDADSLITVYVTLGATPGCIQDISDLPFITNVVPGSRNLQGTFILGAHDSTVAFNSNSVGLNGVISFGYAPDNCASPLYPLGLNQFEFILNNSFQEGAPQESINISAVHGVNCVIRCNIKTDSLTPFNAGPTIPIIQSFANTLNRNQLGLAGVYPYGCTHCTDYIGAPSCIPVPQPVQKTAICQVQRNAVKTNSGLIAVIYLGQEEPLK